MRGIKDDLGYRLEEIAQDVYGVICAQDDSIRGGFGANQGFVILEDSVLVFDSGFSSKTAAFLETAITSLTDKKVRYLVNSHDHSDHVFGNYYFEKKYSTSGLRIISHAICKDKIVKFGQERLEYYKKMDEKLGSLLSSVKICSPNVTYPDTGLKIKLEGIDFVFSHPPVGAHTLGDTILLMPKKNAVFAGDTILNSFFPNMEDANLDGWLDTLDDLDFETYDKFLPGHGDISRKKQVLEFSAYLREVLKKLLTIVPTTADIQQIRSCFETEGTEKWKARFIVERNIQALFGGKTEKQH
ncbi:MAG: MBL fold metallo-hydrolase [Nitrososphaerales archaeon]